MVVASLWPVLGISMSTDAALDNYFYHRFYHRFDHCKTPIACFYSSYQV